MARFHSYLVILVFAAIVVVSSAFTSVAGSKFVQKPNTPTQSKLFQPIPRASLSDLRASVHSWDWPWVPRPQPQPIPVPIPIPVEY
mmetsp:Transcript_120124/g.275200  ORF Transcript_120124/g.275200 Transcript_120124/m.275200 type:complete len:86 (-) Transcript_120124:708-965(-)